MPAAPSAVLSRPLPVRLAGVRRQPAAVAWRILAEGRRLAEARAVRAGARTRVRAVSGIAWAASG